MMRCTAAVEDADAAVEDGGKAYRFRHGFGDA